MSAKEGPNHFQFKPIGRYGHLRNQNMFVGSRIEKLREWTLEGAVFLCGAFVMIFEIVGSRILSPHIGASTYVWTSLIGVILASLSLGYWLGGRAADRNAGFARLSAVIFLSGGLVSLALLTKEVVLSAVSAIPVALELKAVIAATLLFSPASVCLGYVSPYAARLRIRTVENAGRAVGRIYALSTIGSILGTFTAGFVLIPFVGSSRTLYWIAGGLIAVALALAPFSLTRISAACLIMLIFGIGSNELFRQFQFRSNELVDLDTEYTRLQFFRANDPVTGDPIRVLVTDPYSVQSAMFIDSDELVFSYTRFYRLLGHFNPDPKRVLMIGGAGFSYPKDHLKRFEASTLDVVEIDPGMVDAARKYFRLKDDPRLAIVEKDGREFLNQAAGREYDAVLIDAFNSMFGVPFQLTTVEAVRQIERVLIDEGVVIVNIGSALVGPAAGFLEAELATYRAVFPQVYVFKVNKDRPDTALQNVILVAVRSANPVPLQSDRPLLSALLQCRYTMDLRSDAEVLTDDLAPVEYLNAIAHNFRP